MSGDRFALRFNEFMSFMCLLPAVSWTRDELTLAVLSRGANHSNTALQLLSDSYHVWHADRGNLICCTSCCTCTCIMSRTSCIYHHMYPHIMCHPPAHHVPGVTHVLAPHVPCTSSIKKLLTSAIDSSPLFCGPFVT